MHIKCGGPMVRFYAMEDLEVVVLRVCVKHRVATTDLMARVPTLIRSSVVARTKEEATNLLLAEAVMER